MDSIRYVGRKDGTMKMFDTEAEASCYTDDSVAEYKENSDGTYTFVRVVGIKATSDECAALLGGKL